MPATRANLEALAERVMALTGPCRETDTMIALKVGWKFANGAWHDPSTVADSRLRKVGLIHYPSSPEPAFTASIDAAKTLVPEGYWWTVGHVMGPQPCNQNMFWATCHPRDAKWPYTRPIAATPAQALTAAALRAKAKELPE
jgi:hypothetical protein